MIREILTLFKTSFITYSIMVATLMIFKVKFVFILENHLTVLVLMFIMCLMSVLEERLKRWFDDL